MTKFACYSWVNHRFRTLGSRVDAPDHRCKFEKSRLNRVRGMLERTLFATVLHRMGKRMHRMTDFGSLHRHIR